MGLKQRELGNAVKPYTGKAWTSQVVSFIERGERQLDAGELLAVALVLEIPAYALLISHEGDLVELVGKTLKPADVEAAVLGGPGEAAPYMEKLATGLDALAEQAKALMDEAQATANSLRKAGQQPTYRKGQR